MRIAYLCGDSGIPVFGDKGASVHLRDLATAFTRCGHDVLVVANRLGTVREGWPWTAVQAPAVALVDGLDRHPEWRACRANRALRRHLADLHAARPFDVVCERYSLWQYGGLSFARRARLPYILEVNSPLRTEQARWRGLELAGRAARVERFLFSQATSLVAVSAEVGAYAVGAGAPASRVQVVPNGVDLHAFRHAPSTAARPGFTVGFLGSLKPWHGVDTLIAATARLRGVIGGLRVLVVGDGPERAALEAQVATAGLGEHVTFAGAVPKEDVPAWLGRMDVATAPYPATGEFYFSPLKLYDYMAAGVAIVASRVGQISQVLTDGVDALLSMPGDADDLAQRIRQLHDDPACRARLASAARTAAFERHGWELRVSDILRGALEPMAAAQATGGRS